MSDTKLSLEEVAFELLRSKKQSRNEKFPDELISLIIILSVRFHRVYNLVIIN
jgi:hypothetical protein